MAKRNLPKRLFKTPDRISSYQHDRSPIGRMKRVAREHEDVLQNIEFVLVNGRRVDPAIDDRAALEALRASLKDEDPEDESLAELVAALRSMREFREEISDDVWLQAVRVVADSIRRHSELRPGESSYLAFVEPYVQ